MEGASSPCARARDAKIMEGGFASSPHAHASLRKRTPGTGNEAPPCGTTQRSAGELHRHTDIHNAAPRAYASANVGCPATSPTFNTPPATICPRSVPPKPRRGLHPIGAPAHRFRRVALRGHPQHGFRLRRSSGGGAFRLREKAIQRALQLSGDCPGIHQRGKTTTSAARQSGYTASMPSRWTHGRATSLPPPKHPRQR